MVSLTGCCALLHISHPAMSFLSISLSLSKKMTREDSNGSWHLRLHLSFAWTVTEMLTNLVKQKIYWRQRIRAQHQFLNQLHISYSHSRVISPLENIFLNFSATGPSNSMKRSLAWERKLSRGPGFLRYAAGSLQDFAILYTKNEREPSLEFCVLRPSR